MNVRIPTGRAPAGFAVVAALSSILLATAQTAPPDPLPTLQSLRGVPVPEPARLGEFIKDREKAIVLGKALFWDMSVGSDGRTACASCHFHAGADNRVKNQLSPGLNSVNGSPANVMFNKPYPPDASTTTRSGGAGGPNYRLRRGDFPFHVLQDPLDRNSPVLYDTDDVASSQGVFNRAFKAPGRRRMDDCMLLPDPVFMVQGHQTRRVEPRNTPTTINAVFNFRNFWDGRANWVFNGVSPFGNRDADARVFENRDGVITPIRIALEHSSAASQAVGPPGSEFEMSCGGRMFPQIGRRLLPLRPLLRQYVHPQDSALGAYRHPTRNGLGLTYADLVRAAFQDKYWNGTQQLDLGGVTFSQMEANFSLFFGLAIQMYEGTLVSDDAPLDRFLGAAGAPGDPNALSEQERLGMAIFLGKGKCINCHKGPQLTGAGTPLIRENQQDGLVERMLMGDERVALYDNGFYNIGVRPTFEDLGVGAKDPFGSPLSFTRQFLNIVAGRNAPDPFQVNPCSFEVDPCVPVIDANHREAVDGAFKTPGLRNVALTGPYFHNGGQATLEQVVAFYNRGGDRRGPNGSDTTGFGRNPSNLDADITPLGLTDDEQTALVAFLRNVLTDERVRWERAPFDHPELFITHGHIGNEYRVLPNPFNGAALDSLREVKAVGANGRSIDLGPLRSFDAGLAP